jgi:Raf kinase inhibitor-like YbhB/YbcL family protein
MLRSLVLGLFALLAAGCAGKRDPVLGTKDLPQMKMSSTAFADKGTILVRYTHDGKDAAPGIKWSDAPEGTRSFALICEDPDAPGSSPFVHWLIWNIPGDQRELPEGSPDKGTLPDGARQGKNGFGNIGYNGPAPPHGPWHHYYFKLYALDTLLDVPEGAERSQLETAMKDHVIASGQIMGMYMH